MQNLQQRHEQKVAQDSALTKHMPGLLPEEIY